MQHRQKMPIRGVAKWLQRGVAATSRALGLGDTPATVLQQSQGLVELEGLHACIAESLARMRETFGDVLAMRCREATFYKDLRELELDSQELTAAMIGG